MNVVSSLQSLMKHLADAADTEEKMAAPVAERDRDEMKTEEEEEKTDRYNIEELDSHE